jgi:hypothetical protein
MRTQRLISFKRLPEKRLWKLFLWIPDQVGTLRLLRKYFGFKSLKNDKPGKTASSFA